MTPRSSRWHSGPGVVGAVATGVIAWGTPTGGCPGLEGEYALQNATITPWWQLARVLAIVVLAAVPCLIICLAFERFGGLRVPEDDEVGGPDATARDVPPSSAATSF